VSDKNVAERQAAEELERQGDKAAKAEDREAAGSFYRKAQKILLPTGVMWSDAVEYDLRMTAFDRVQQKIWALSGPPAPPEPAAPSEAYKKFADSTNISYEQWHDGIGYDIDALSKVTDKEREVLAARLIARFKRGRAEWRDIEALGALNLPQTREVLQQALPLAKRETRLHIARELATMGVKVEIDKIIAEILHRGRYEEGLSLAIDFVPEYATPYLRNVLLDCARIGHPDVRVHAAALCLYLAGQADEPFDWKHRPFFLEFGEEDPAILKRAFEELCRRIGSSDGHWPQAST
jgi:hypothetical protein